MYTELSNTATHSAPGDQSPHYVRALADMSEHRCVVAHEDIYAANGMKLLAKGARISGRDHERLSLHKLRTPLDLVLSAEDAVDSNKILADLTTLLAEDTFMAGIVERAGNASALRLGVKELAISGPLCFRLTVMRDQRTSLYSHTLRVAIITSAMAHELHFSHQEKEDLLLASLCHDIGEMHTDPILLAPEHQIAPDERRFIDVHPLTAHVLLNDIGGIAPAVLRAVLQHHERLDGSGYPNRAVAGDISRLARLLAIAEVIEAVGRRDGLGQLDIVLRLSHDRLDKKACNVLRHLVQLDDGDFTQSRESGDLAAQAMRVTNVLVCWQRLEAMPAMAAMAFLGKRMDAIRSAVLQTGIDPNDSNAIVVLAQTDPQLGAELGRTLTELEWMIVDVARELERRAPSCNKDTWQAVQSLLAILQK